MDRIKFVDKSVDNSVVEEMQKSKEAHGFFDHPMMTDILEKAKYIKREGTPGNYRYEYAKVGGQKTKSPDRPGIGNSDFDVEKFKDFTATDHASMAKYHFREMKKNEAKRQEYKEMEAKEGRGIGAPFYEKQREHNRQAWKWHEQMASAKRDQPMPETNSLVKLASGRTIFRVEHPATIKAAEMLNRDYDGSRHAVESGIFSKIPEYKNWTTSHHADARDYHAEKKALIEKKYGGRSGLLNARGEMARHHRKLHRLHDEMNSLHSQEVNLNPKTESGKPIEETRSVEEAEKLHPNFTAKDHEEARQHWAGMAGRLVDKVRAGDEGAKRLYDEYDKMAGHHAAAKLSKSESVVQKSESLGCFEPLVKAKTGEGSRGGKIIGHTSSGKPIYDSATDYRHALYSAQDHDDAAQHHRSGYFKADEGKDDKKKQYHIDQAKVHEERKVEQIKKERALRKEAEDKQARADRYWNRVDPSDPHARGSKKWL